MGYVHQTRVMILANISSSRHVCSHWHFFLLLSHFYRFSISPYFLIWNMFTDYLHVSYLVLYKHNSLIFWVFICIWQKFVGKHVCTSSLLHAHDYIYFSNPGCRHLLIINNITICFERSQCWFSSETWMNEWNNNESKIWIKHSHLYLCILHRDEHAWCAYLSSLSSQDVWNLYARAWKVKF